MKNPPHWHVGRCPNGKQTNSFNVYQASWKRLYRRMEKLTGLTCTGMDTSLDFQEIKNGKYVEGGSIRLPVWFCYKLLNGIEKERKEVWHKQWE
jgi:hypothetical protein